MCDSDKFFCAKYIWNLQRQWTAIRINCETVRECVYDDDSICAATNENDIVATFLNLSSVINVFCQVKIHLNAYLWIDTKISYIKSRVNRRWEVHRRSWLNIKILLLLVIIVFQIILFLCLALFVRIPVREINNSVKLLDPLIIINYANYYVSRATRR